MQLINNDTSQEDKNIRNIVAPRGPLPDRLAPVIFTALPSPKSVSTAVNVTLALLGVLSGVGWQLDTKVSGKHIGSIVKGQAAVLALEDGLDVPKRR